MTSAGRVLERLPASTANPISGSSSRGVDMSTIASGRTAPRRHEMDYRAAFAAHADDVLPPGYLVVHRLAPIRPSLDGDRVFWIIDGPT